MLKTLRKNEEIKGKIVTFKTFRDTILDELNKNFPEEYDVYMKTRQSESSDAVSSMVLDTDQIKKE